MKFLFYTSMSVFFTRYSHILGNNFSSDTTTAGIIIAYTNALLFASTYMATQSKPSTYFAEPVFLILILSVIFVCFSSSYLLYLIGCIPLVFCRCYINLIWKDLLSERKNDTLVELNNTVGILSDLTVPLLFGIMCDFIGFGAILLFTNVPLLMSYVILKKYSYRPLAETRSDEKEL